MNKQKLLGYIFGMRNGGFNMEMLDTNPHTFPSQDYSDWQAGAIAGSDPGVYDMNLEQAENELARDNA